MSQDEVVPGTLDMLVLKSLQLGAMHGWGIAERLDAGSGGVFQLNQGSLYPALYRLERQGLVTSRPPANAPSSRNNESGNASPTR